MTLRFDLDTGSAAEGAVERWWRQHRKAGARRKARVEHAQGAWHTWTLELPPRLLAPLLHLLEAEGVALLPPEEAG